MKKSDIWSFEKDLQRLEQSITELERSIELNFKRKRSVTRSLIIWTTLLWLLLAVAFWLFWDSFEETKLRLLGIATLLLIPIMYARARARPCFALCAECCAARAV